MRRSQPTSIQAEGERPVRVTEALQKVLGRITARHPCTALLRVDARCGSHDRRRRLTLVDLARAWPDAQRVRAPLKALDRLLNQKGVRSRA